MPYLFGLMCLLALGIVGCSETTGTEGTGLCEGVTCDDGNQCTKDECSPADGSCSNTAVEDDSFCDAGYCQSGECEPIASIFPCTEQGILDAIAEGGGPHGFACNGPTVVTTTAEIVIDHDVILDGEGNLTVDGNHDHRVFSMQYGIEAELHRFTITKGYLGGAEGAGISNYGTLTLTNTTVSGNRTDTGGGGGISNYGTLSLTNSTVLENTADTGGGIFNDGALTLTNSTVTGNSAYDGGGIYNYTRRTLTLTNSTVTGNSASAGGGILNSGGAVTLTNSTVSGNTANVGRGLVSGNGGTLLLSNTLIDNDCAYDAPLSGGHNIESPGDTCGFTDPTDLVNITAAELNLGELADNGGPTETHALGADSVAIDQIPAEDCVDADGEPLTTDQRGEPRPEPGGTDCDVGAFEVQP